MELLYSALPPAFARVPAVILDGRPYTTRLQRRRARDAAADAGADVAFVLCTAPAPVLRQRVRSGPHLAADRDPALVERLSAEWEPFEGDAVVIDTGACTPAEAVEACLRGLRRPQ
jgi:predicted kinase